jgi:hypothetical protein
MAELPTPQLTFQGTCPDCGERLLALPDPLPTLGDDFDWRVRDYDGFRLDMLEELAARFPERTRWTPGDLEVVLVEVLAAVLDQLSDQLDRVSAEAYLETARRPESVRRHLALIGYDAVLRAAARGEITLPPGEPSDSELARRLLATFWRGNPHAMEAARRAGPREIQTQHRMVTVEDYALRLAENPLVARAHAWSAWSGSWTTVYVAVITVGDVGLDAALPADLAGAVETFHREHELPQLPASPPPTVRTVLTMHLDAYRMAGQEVILAEAAPIPVTFSLSVRVAANFYQSEVRRAVTEALGTGPLGFFRPGGLRFGEDLHSSNLIQAVAALDGVESVCLNRFKRLGSEFPDEVGSGRIVLRGLEVAVCDNDPAQPARGYYRLTLHGGLKG